MEEMEFVFGLFISHTVLLVKAFLARNSMNSSVRLSVPHTWFIPAQFSWFWN